MVYAGAGQWFLQYHECDCLAYLELRGLTIGEGSPLGETTGGSEQFGALGDEVAGNINVP